MVEFKEPEMSHEGTLSGKQEVLSIEEAESEDDEISESDD